jgi:hypothetical protein
MATESQSIRQQEAAPTITKHIAVAIAKTIDKIRNFTLFFIFVHLFKFVVRPLLGRVSE